MRAEIDYDAAQRTFLADGKPIEYSQALDLWDAHNCTWSKRAWTQIVKELNIPIQYLA